MIRFIMAFDTFFVELIVSLRNYKSEYVRKSVGMF